MIGFYVRSSFQTWLSIGGSALDVAHEQGLMFVINLWPGHCTRMKEIFTSGVARVGGGKIG